MYTIFYVSARTLYSVDEEDSEDDTIRPLSDQCADEVERVLEERAISVQLHPEIDDACRADLTRFCIAATDVGQEMKCLQVFLFRSKTVLSVSHIVFTIFFHWVYFHFYNSSQ